MAEGRRATATRQVAHKVYKDFRRHSKGKEVENIV